MAGGGLGLVGPGGLLGRVDGQGVLVGEHVVERAGQVVLVEAGEQVRGVPGPLEGHGFVVGEPHPLDEPGRHARLETQDAVGDEPLDRPAHRGPADVVGRHELPLGRDGVVRPEGAHPAREGLAELDVLGDGAVGEAGARWHRGPLVRQCGAYWSVPVRTCRIHLVAIAVNAPNRADADS